MEKFYKKIKGSVLEFFLEQKINLKKKNTKNEVKTSRTKHSPYT